MKIEQTRSYVGDDLEVTIECTLNANALERTSLGIYNRSEITVEAYDKNDKNLNANAYQILGSDEEELLQSLVVTGYVTDASDVSAIIEVSSEQFKDAQEVADYMLWLENNLCTQDQDQEVPEEP